MKYNHLSRLSLSSLAFILVACGATMAQETAPETKSVEPEKLEQSKRPEPVDPKIAERQRKMKQRREIQQRRSIQTDPQAVLKRTVQQLYRLDADGVVTREDFDRLESVQAAQIRSQKIGSFLAYDLDGNLSVEREEVSAFAEANRNRNGRAEIEIAFLNNDSNDDGALSIEEISIFVKNDNKKLRRGNSQREQLQLFDVNGDGTVSVQEVSEAIKKISDEPIPEPTNTHQRKAKAVCELPPPSAGAEIIAVSGYEGDALSTVAVSGLDDETTVVSIKIEEGDKPLYIFANVYQSNIWKITGATDRVEKFVVQQVRTKTGPGAGVSGLEEGVVSFVPTGSCGKYAKSSEGGEALLLKSKLGFALGRPVDKVVAHYTLENVELPSGKVKKRNSSQRTGPIIQTDRGAFAIVDGKPVNIEKGKFGRAESSLKRFHPGGIVAIDLNSVVAPSPVEAYDVLPQEAGILQLLNSGHLRKTSDGYYVIEKTFARFPAGLSGAHGVKFILAKGVELPGGSPGHSTVISEETGECLAGARCRMR